jgi:nucleotide-binding universal stress UspA family protein
MHLDKIVIGVDFTPASIHAAKWAAHHFVGSAEMVLAYSVFTPQPPRFLRGRYPNIGPLVDVAREGAEVKLRGLARQLPAGLIWTDVRLGAPAEQLAAVARDYAADLIVVGAHEERYGLWGRIGSTAERLITHASVPVLIAAGMRDLHPRRILVALDDADITPTVLRWAHFLGTRFNATVTAIHVISSAVLSHVLSVESATSKDQIFDQRRVSNEFAEDSDKWMRSLLGAGLDRSRVSSEVRFGEASQEIVNAADQLNVDLIVMGSRGAGSVGRWVLGSVSAAVLRAAPCPVLVISESDVALESTKVRSSGESGVVSVPMPATVVA